MRKTALWLQCSLFFLSLIVFSPLDLRAERTSIHLRVGDRAASVSGYDSSGVIFVSVREYAAALSFQAADNPDRKKIELRLPNYRVKITASNPFLIVTSVGTGVSSSYQLANKVLYVDSTYFAPAHDFVALLERLDPSGVSLESPNGEITKGREERTARFDITGADLEPYSNGYLLTIQASRKLDNFEAFLSADGWLYLTVTDAIADTLALSRFKPNDAIRRLQVYQYPTSVQLTFKVSSDIVQVDPIVDQQTNNVLLALHSKAALEKAEREKRQLDQMQDKLQRARTRASLDVIVIDAGHGGKDPGTIGVAGTREKDVTLAVALKLGRILEKELKDVKVVYTRKTDVFVELGERAKIANRENGKLFISIHCNSAKRKPSAANGFEIYIIKPEKTTSAIRSAEGSQDVADRENKVIEYEEGYEARYQEVTNEESFILLTMRQSAFARHSEDFAEKASEAMANLLKIQNSGVRQAGFYVLVYASMPNVLVETGYLSNRAEEKVLRSADGQKKIAEALLKGIVSFKKAYEDALNEGQPSEPQGN
jgi:N-acetylmuramoyl-L-alanine amidase